MPEPYDVAIIGGGPGGYVGAIRAAQLGLRTAVVEREKLGGTCLHVGCIPTKALLHTAELVERLKDAADLGVRVGEVGVDLTAAHRRKARVVETLHKGVQYLMRKHKVDVFTGAGRFLGPQKVGVALADGSETELLARHVIIATGSAPRSLPGIAIDNRRILDSTGALALEAVPTSIAILGAGPVGVEFASLFRAFGSEVALIELLPTLVPLEDEEVGQALERAFARRGIKTFTRATAQRAQVQGERVAITVATGDATQTLEADYLLVAIGRAPVTAELALAEAGVAWRWSRAPSAWTSTCRPPPQASTPSATSSPGSGRSAWPTWPATKPSRRSSASPARRGTPSTTTPCRARRSPSPRWPRWASASRRPGSGGTRCGWGGSASSPTARRSSRGRARGS